MDQLKRERAIGNCALTLLSTSTGDGAVVDECLKELGAAVSATRVVLFELDPDNNYGDATYEWHHPDQSPQRGARYKSSELPEAFEVFNRGDTVVATIEGGPKYLGLQANMAVEKLALLVITPIRRGGRTAWASVFSWHGSSAAAEIDRIAFCERATRIVDAGLARVQEFRAQETQAEKRLHSQRLESIGLLAGGIAHDFNNVLQGIIGLSELLQRTQSGEAEIEITEELINIAQRASKITGRLLVFSSQEVREAPAINVADALRDALAFLRRSIPEDRELQLTLEDSDAYVCLASTDFEQAIINLCNNSSAAVAGGGRIELGCRLVEGDAIEVWVRDDGVGMSADQLAQAREPFFTTKSAGEGTGLGLAMVDTLVQRAGGSLRIESAPGEGALVTMRLPTCDASESPFPARQASTVKGTETVLVAEDDPLILRVASSHLERAGFTPLMAASYQEALTQFREHQPEIRLVVSDAIMPGGGAAELHKAITKEVPTMPFLFATGYDPGTLSPELLSKPHCSLLQKPYEANALLRLVRQLIDTAP